MKLKQIIQRMNKAAHIYYDVDYQEYQVKFYIDSKYQINADYHTDELADARDTANYFVNN